MTDLAEKIIAMKENMRTISGIKHINLYLVVILFAGALIVLVSLDSGLSRGQAAPAAKAVCSDIARRYDDALSGASGACQSRFAVYFSRTI